MTAPSCAVFRCKPGEPRPVVTVFGRTAPGKPRTKGMFLAGELSAERGCPSSRRINFQRAASHKKPSRMKTAASTSAHSPRAKASFPIILPSSHLPADSI